MFGGFIVIILIVSVNLVFDIIDVYLLLNGLIIVIFFVVVKKECNILFFFVFSEFLDSKDLGFDINEMLI